MKRFKLCMVSMLVFFLVIIGIVVVIIVGFFLYNWIITDETAEIRGEGSILVWNDVWYREARGEYREGRLIAKTSDGDYLYKVVGDQDLNFVVVREAGFIGASGDARFMMREDHQITTNEVTKVGDSKDPELCRSMQEILIDDSDIFFDILPENTLWWNYAGDPPPGFVPAVYYDHSSVGWYETVAYVQGKYVILDIDDERESDPIDDYKVAVRCKVIDEKYLPILRKHLGGVLDAAVEDAKVREEQTSSP